MGAVKTADPHPESYFGLCCWALDQAETSQLVFPASVSPDVLRNVYGGDPDLLPNCLVADHAARHKSLTELSRLCVRQFLEAAGMPAPAFHNPTCELSALEGDLVRQVRMAFEPPSDIPVRDESDGWRPPRALIKRVVLALYLGAEDNTLDGLARTLNQGVPSKDAKAFKLTKHNVRTALAASAKEEVAYAKGALRRPDLRPDYATVFDCCARRALNDARAFEVLWKLAKDPSWDWQRSLPERADELKETGELFRAFEPQDGDDVFEPARLSRAWGRLHDLLQKSLAPSKRRAA